MESRTSVWGGDHERQEPTSDRVMWAGGLVYYCTIAVEKAGLRVFVRFSLYKGTGTPADNLVKNTGLSSVK